jgi:hypothetical protein
MQSANPSWREATSNVTYALSLTALMAVALFTTVGMNPKAEGYGNLPWYYAGSSLLIGVVLNIISRRVNAAEADSQPEHQGH